MVANSPKLTRRERRAKRETDTENNQRINFTLKRVDPMTDNQRVTFESFKAGKNLLLHGIAGTGKSFVSIYLALRLLLESGTEKFKKVVIVRSVVPTRDMGFLPGSNKDKTKVYESPYASIFTELFERGDAYEYLKSRGLVEFMSTSFIRGITLNDCLIIVDEMQNMDWGELTSIMTRVGKNCRIVFCGDFRQSDFRFKEKESRNDVIRFMDVLKKMKDEFEFVEFGPDDIVRSRLVKKFILAMDELGYT